MLVLRSSSQLTTHNNWTPQRTLPLDKNCPQQQQNQQQFTKSSQLISSQKQRANPKNNYSRQQPNIPTVVVVIDILQKPLFETPIHNFNAQFLITVIQKLPFLMNEIRTKKNFSSILNNCSPFTNKKHQHLVRRHLVSKSNKVFLRYTPRDPRLRFIINKHSELSEYLCNYGELIGGKESCRKSEELISFSVFSLLLRSKFSKQLRHGDKIFVTNSSFIHGEGKKKNSKKLFKSIY